MKKQKPISQEILSIISKTKQRELSRKKKYGDIKPIISAKAGGKRFVAIGGHMHGSDKWKTFPDFLHDYIMIIFGEKWFNSEISKPAIKRHPVIQWRYSIHEFLKHQKINNNGLYKIIPSGPYKAYLTLAYDIYLLEHHLKIQEAFVKRLRIIDQFQGARYELFAASNMIRAGFDLAYDLQTKEGAKVVEFLATHKDTGVKIAIEAKSRHRPGVLGQGGDKESPKSIRIRLGQLINNAINKKPDYPYFIFIDMNLPPEKTKDFIDAGIKEMISSLKNAPEAENEKDYYNLILYTNFPYHYGADLKSYPEDHLSAVLSLAPIYPLPNKSFLNNIRAVVKKYGCIPNIFEGDD